MDKRHPAVIRTAVRQNQGGACSSTPAVWQPTAWERKLIRRLAPHLVYRAWAIRWLRRLWPELALYMALETELWRPANLLLWVYDATETDVPADLLDEIGELINRAPAPLGLDDYLVRVCQLTAVPGEAVEQLTFDQADATLGQRRAVAGTTLSGDRWYDWKRGAGRAAVAAVLQRLCPTPHRPVTSVQVAMSGAVVRQLGL